MQPQRFHFVAKYREYIDRYPLRLPLLKINPNLISFISVIFSLLFLIIWQSNLPQKIPISFTCLIFGAMLDWLDGLTARKYHLASEKGWIVDTTCDRLSEFFILLSFSFFPWFYLLLWNVLFSWISWFVKKQITFPLRLIFLVYFLIKFVL